MGVNAYGGWSASPRTITNGWLGIRYTSSTDLLEFKAFDIEDNLAAYGAYPNFKNLGIDPWMVFIGGYSDGAVLIEGPANLDNFQAEVVPEPASMVLFLTGAAALAARRYITKRKK